MEIKNYFAQDAQGNIMPSANCYLYFPGTTNLATGLVDGNGVPISNPFLASGMGQITFGAPNGVYDLRVTLGARDWTIKVQCADIAQAMDVMDSILGSHAENPTTRNNGQPLEPGDETWNSTDKQPYWWNGTAWVALNSSAQQLEVRMASPNGAKLSGYTYGTAHSEGREVSDKLQEARSILDFVPRAQKSAMKDGTSRWSATVAMNYALRETAGGILIPPGCIVPIDGPIDLDRSNEIVGGGPFDTTPGKGSKIYMLDGSNCEAIRTPYAVNPVTGSQTHFMGLRNLVIDGNKSGQTAEVAGGLVKFWGAFVGSWIEKVLILNSYGTALDLRGGSDVELSHLWIAGCATETGYALDTNAQLTGGTLGGLLQFSNLYVENTSIDKNFSAKENEAYRGKNIRFRRLVSLSATDIHTEGAAIGVDLDQNTLVNIGKITSYNIGSTNTTEGSLVRHIGGMSRAVNIGPMTMSGRTNDPYFVRKSADLPVNNFVPEVKRLTNPFVNRYTSVYDSLLPYSKESPAAYSGVVAVERPNGFSEVAIRMTWGDSADPSSGISRFKEKGQGPVISSNINQPGGVDKDFISARSSGGAGDSITLSDPFKPGSRSTAASIQAGMIYLGTALPSIGTGPAFQRLTGLAAGADALATARRVNGPPTTGADSIGIFYTDTSTPAPHKVYMSTNFTGEVSDWSPLN